jgi:hypothetical protein
MHREAGMDETTKTARPAGAYWATADGPSTKQRQGAQRAVSRLLELLAPEVPAARREAPVPEILCLRTARGCILQGHGGAVSVSWFPSAGSERSLGELQVTLWRGTVARPGGTSRAPSGATTLREVNFLPVESEDGGWRWRASDGMLLDTDALAVRCRALLGESVQDGIGRVAGTA